MKTMYSMLIYSVLILLNTANVVSSVHKEEVKKEYHEEYNVDDNSLLFMDNKFGNINIINWDKDEVVIDAEVVVRDLSTERAREILDNINIDFSQSGGEIKVITSIEDGFRMNNGNKELNINFSVRMPTYLSVDLNNKYGNITAEDLNGKTLIQVKYGNLSVHELGRGDEKPLNEIKLAYSNGEIEECGWLKLELSYSKIEIGDGQAFMILSKYSKFYGDVISSIVSESKYDKYEIGEINNFVCSSGYTNVKIETLRNQLKTETKYSDVKINHINKDFESLEIETKYGGYKLGIDPLASYKLDGSANYARIDYPEAGNVRESRDNTEQTVTGYVGDDPNSGSTVTVETKYGNVKLNYNQ